MANEITVRGPRSWVNDILLGDGINKSGTITMSLAPTKGDCYLKGGAVDVDAWTCEGGFILGVDDSDSDLAKFFVGNTASSFMSWDGAAMTYQIGSGDALTVKGGGNIVLEDGGDIIFALSDANPALIKWGAVHNLGAASTTARGLCLWPTVADQDSFRIGYDPVNNIYSRFSAVGIYTTTLINLKSSYDASDFSEISLFSGDGTSYIYFQVNKNGVAKTARIYPEGYLSVDAIHVGGAADPGANNLVVDSLAGGGDRYLYTVNNGLVTAGAGYP